MRILLCISLFMATLVPSATAWGWGSQGHRTTAAIADRLLNAPARAAVRELLANDLDAGGHPSNRHTLEAIANWADEIRDTSMHHASWHYDDRPVCGNAMRSSYCSEGNCNTSQTQKLLAVLGNPSVSTRRRNEALKWIVHLVGDIHQPLHAAGNDDAGGNDVRIELVGIKTWDDINLHNAWDTPLVKIALGTGRRANTPRNIDALAAEANSLLGTEQLGTPRSWAAESNEFARTVVYDFDGFVCRHSPQGVIRLDAAYQAKAAGVIRKRLLLGGARLAGVLNQALGGRSN